MSDVTSAQTALREMRIDDAIAAFEHVLRSEPDNIPAHLGLYEAYQVKGRREPALEHQMAALRRQRIYFEKPAPAGAPTMLVVAVPGDWQANVPLEFLFPSLHLGIQKLFVSAELGFPDAAALNCDVIFNAVAQSETADETLAVLETWLPKTNKPVLNEPALVRRLTRDGVAREFRDVAGMLVPQTRRVTRAALPSAPQEPLVVRPVGSQAGAAFSRIETATEMSAYLAANPEAEFYLSPFIDYRSDDGYYRKYRIIFVGDVPYPLHLAISDRWMVHFYNALNAEESWIRSEEERFLADVYSVFDGPRRSALLEIARRVGLDYFGIDCGVMPDGRIVLFEVDPAMIVHLGDRIELYPYKHRYVPRIPAALEVLIASRAAGSRSLEA